jgi:hypothetical protein
MASIISWIGSNWQTVLTALLAIDAAIIPIFPNATIFQKIQSWLKSV